MLEILYVLRWNCKLLRLRVFLLSTAEAVLRRTLTVNSCSAFWNFYCLPLRRYWDKHSGEQFSVSKLPFLLSTAEAVLRPCFVLTKYSFWGNFYCLPLRRYWDRSNEVCDFGFGGISIVYRWGGIETKLGWQYVVLFVVFLLSTAEAVLRLAPRFSYSPLSNFYCLPLRRYWDAIAAAIQLPKKLFLLSTAEAVLRQNCKHQNQSDKQYYFYCLPLRRYWDTHPAWISTSYSLFLLSTAEAVLRPVSGSLHLKILRISIVYRWGGIEPLFSGDVDWVFAGYFYCLPLRRYWDS